MSHSGEEGGICARNGRSTKSDDFVVGVKLPVVGASLSTTRIKVNGDLSPIWQSIRKSGVRRLWPHQPANLFTIPNHFQLFESSLWQSDEILQSQVRSQLSYSMRSYVPPRTDRLRVSFNNVNNTESISRHWPRFCHFTTLKDISSQKGRGKLVSFSS